MDSCANCERVGYYTEATHMGNDGYGNIEPLCEACRGYALEPEGDETETGSVQYADGFVFVNVYEVDRVYGGPEEGGWYYDAGRLITSRQVTEESAEDMKLSLQIKYPKTGDSSSVIYSGGDYRVWIEDHPGADFPEYTPHYE